MIKRFSGFTSCEVYDQSMLGLYRDDKGVKEVA